MENRTELTHYELVTADLGKMLKRDLVPIMVVARNQIKKQRREIDERKDQIRQATERGAADHRRMQHLEDMNREMRQFIRSTLDVRHAKLESLSFGSDISTG